MADADVDMGRIDRLVDLGASTAITIAFKMQTRGLSPLFVDR